MLHVHPSVLTAATNCAASQLLGRHHYTGGLIPNPAQVASRTAATTGKQQHPTTYICHKQQYWVCCLLLDDDRTQHSQHSNTKGMCAGQPPRAQLQHSQGRTTKKKGNPIMQSLCTWGQAAQHFHQSASAGGTAWLANSSRGRNAAASLPPHPFLADTHTDTCTCWHTRVARSGLLLLLLRCPHTTPRKPRAAPAQLPQLLWQHTSQHRPTAGSSSSRTRSPGPCPLQSQPSQKCPCWQSPPLSRCRRSPASLLCC